MKIKLIISVLIISLVIGVGAGLFVIKHEVKILEK
jgi:F0F1-type ATP synthase assembly protein I